MDETNLSAQTNCRACLQKQLQSQMYSLASKNMPIKENINQSNVEMVNLSEIYNQCTQLIYEQMNPNWEWICQDCVGILVEFFKFRKMCRESYAKLKEIDKLSVERLKNSESKLKIEVVDVAKILESHNDTVLCDEEYFDNEQSSISSSSDYEIALHSENKHQAHQATDRRRYALRRRCGTTTKGNSTIEYRSSSVDAEYTKTVKLVNISELPNELEEAHQSANTEKSSSNESIHVCDICSKKFFKKHRYDAHRRIHLGLKQWKCEHCEKAFEKYSTLKSHIEVKHYDSKEKPIFVCDFEGCGKSYSLKESLRVHIKHIHMGKKPNISAKICEQCGKSFKTNHSLIKHSYTHSKVTPYKCHICSKMFATKYKLKEHLMRHEGIRNFVCPICGARKTTGHELRVHMNHHSNNIKYPCEICLAVFTRVENMKRHMRVVHCGIKPFPCSQCDRSFAKAETLKHHIMTHTGERPLSCSICEKKFIQAIALKTHMKTHSKKK